MRTSVDSIMKIIVLFLSVVSAAFSAKEICGGTYRGFQYTITSPNYPNNYDLQVDCIYNLEADASVNCEQQFHLQFLDFDVKASENCKEDHLQVGDRHIFCGNVVGLRKFSGTNNTLTLRFHSNQELSTTKGFKILVTALPCNLKLSPVKNHSFKGFREVDQFGLNANDIPSRAYHLGIRGGDEKSGGDNSATRLTLTSSNVINSSSVTSQSTDQQRQQDSTISRPQIDFAFENNARANLVPPLLPSHYSGTMAVKDDSPHIISYVFLPPRENNGTAPKAIAPSIKDKSFDTVTSPPNQLLPPSPTPPRTFSKIYSSKVGLSTDDSAPLTGQIQRLAVPPSLNYGEPPRGLVDYDIQVGNDCDQNTATVRQSIGVGSSSERINYDPIQGQDFQSNPNLIYDPRWGFVSSNHYPQPNYPGNNPGYNPITPNYPGNNPGYNPITPNYPVNNPGYNPIIPIYPGNNPGYNPITPIYPPNYPGYNPGYTPITPNYPGYNPGYNSITPNYPGYNPNYPVGGGGYPNLGTGWNNGQNGECCRVQIRRRFSIVSPGFPGGTFSNSYSCRYAITKSSPDVCRLILNLRFFNFGTDDPSCSYGFIEIDGRRYCGCKSGQSIQVLFTDYIAKYITVFYTGYPRTRFTGFLIDIIQESCGSSGGSYPSYPSYPFDPTNPLYPNSVSNNGYPYSYIQRRKDFANSTIEQRNIFKRSQNSSIIPSPIDPNPYIRNKRDLGYSYDRPSTSFLNNDVQLIPTSDRAQTHQRIFGGSCQNRIFLDWTIAAKETLLRNIGCGGYQIPGLNSRSYLPPLTNRDVGSSALTECEDISVNQGVIKSPSYPNNYPSNINKCYRFNKAPNFCKLEVYIRDFDVESSEGCTKDYLSFSTDNKKYCGSSLNDYRTILDLTQTNFIEIFFSSDSHGTGRGFHIGFSQLPCEVTSNF